MSLIDFLEDFAQVANLKGFTRATDLESVTEEINENIPNIESIESIGNTDL